MDIRIVTPVVPTGLTQASDFEGILGPEDSLTYVEIEAGPASIETEFDKMLAAPETVARVIEAEADGMDAVVIDCMCDPGLQAARECVDIPVLGPCMATMNLACMLGHRFSVLAVSDTMRPIFENQAKVYGAWEKYASTRAIDIAVLDLKDDPDAVVRAMSEQAVQAIEEDGADTVIVGCTGMVGTAGRLRDRLQALGYRIPVLDPVPDTVRLAKALVTSGLSQSKIAYPTPAPKEIRGYEIFGPDGIAAD